MHKKKKKGEGERKTERHDGTFSNISYFIQFNVNSGRNVCDRCVYVIEVYVVTQDTHDLFA